MIKPPNSAEVLSISACTSTSAPLKRTRHTVSCLACHETRERERERERTAATRTKVVVVVRIARAPVRRALRTMLERLVAVADAVDRIGSGQRGKQLQGEVGGLTRGTSGSLAVAGTAPQRSNGPEHLRGSFLRSAQRKTSAQTIKPRSEDANSPPHRS